MNSKLSWFALVLTYKLQDIYLLGANINKEENIHLSATLLSYKSQDSILN